MSDIYSEGKLVFTSRLHARQIQYKLKQAGYVYEVGSQRIRPGAYGVMWSNEFQGKHNKKKTMCTAGTERVFAAYRAHRKPSIYVDMSHNANTEAGRAKVFENCQEAQRQTTKIVFSIFDYLLGLDIGYDFTARRTKTGTPIRVATWTAFAHLLHELHPHAKPWQVRRAIKARYTNAPEDKKLKELLATRRPEGLAIGAIKI